jgi:hypothetical protein
MTETTKLTRHEKDQLYSIGCATYRDGSPYWWGKATMPKLAAKGLVEPHPDHPKAWRITAAGQAEWDKRGAMASAWL